MAMVPGWVGRLRINGAFYAYGRCRPRGRVDNLRTTNSEGYNPVIGIAAAPGFHTSLNGNSVMTLDVTQVTYDPALAFNPFLAPYNIFDGAYVSVAWYPAGIAFGFWSCASFHIIECGNDSDVNGLTPFDFTGEGNGAWFPPLA